jgi:hypothetical protein
MEGGGGEGGGGDGGGDGGGGEGGGDGGGGACGGGFLKQMVPLKGPCMLPMKRLSVS